jgi:hypothetical protein
MSVSLSRFVNVMSGGKYGRGSTKAEMQKSDTKTLGMLNAMQAALDKHAKLVTPDPKLLTLHQGLWSRLQTTEGRTGKKLLDYLDEVATKTGQALKLAEAYAQGITPKVEARQELINAIRLDLGTQFKSLPTARIDAKLKASITTALDAIKDEMDLLEAGEPFASVQALDANLKQLRVHPGSFGGLA